VADQAAIDAAVALLRAEGYDVTPPPCPDCKGRGPRLERDDREARS
jgi:hypothetical protein